MQQKPAISALKQQKATPGKMLLFLPVKKAWCVGGCAGWNAGNGLGWYTMCMETRGYVYEQRELLIYVVKKLHS